MDTGIGYQGCYIVSSWVDFLVLDYIVGSEACGSVANSVANSVAVDNAVTVDDAVAVAVPVAVDAAAVAVVDGNSVELLVILGDM